MTVHEEIRLGALAPILFSVAGSLWNFQQFISLEPSVFLAPMMGMGQKIACLSIG